MLGVQSIQIINQGVRLKVQKSISKNYSCHIETGFSKCLQNTVVDTVTQPLLGCPCSDLKPVQMVPCSDSVEDVKKLRILRQKIILAYLVGPVEILRTLVREEDAGRSKVGKGCEVRSRD